MGHFITLVGYSVLLLLKVSSAQDTPSEVTVSSAELNPVEVTTDKVDENKRRACVCLEGSCSCCTGYFLANTINISVRNRACVNVTYEPDEFEFHFKMLFNDRMLYQNRISAKNPRPVCLPIQRFINAKMCAKFTNVYMLGRNLHACLNLEGQWQSIELFNVSFDCFRIGVNGIAIVKPEEGGGIPIPVVEEDVDPEDLEYNDSA